MILCPRGVAVRSYYWNFNSEFNFIVGNTIHVTWKPWKKQQQRGGQ